MKQKTLKTTIILGEGEFSGGGNTKVFEGYATTCQVTKAGLPEKNSAEVRIHGLKMADMEQLTFLSFMPASIAIAVPKREHPDNTRFPDHSPVQIFIRWSKFRGGRRHDAAR